MIEFKISVFTGTPSCTNLPYPKIGEFNGTLLFDRYAVYINNIPQLTAVAGTTGELNTFQASIPLNSVVEIKIVDNTGEIDTYTNSFQLYDRSGLRKFACSVSLIRLGIL